MKKLLLVIGILILPAGSLLAGNHNGEVAISKIDSPSVMFCDAGWADVEEYWDSGGDDGFYAGYLYCHACPGECNNQ